VTLAELDTTLADLRFACERIGANLLDVELDPASELLDGLQGVSAARWSAAGETLLELWRCHGLLEQLLARADAVRGTRGRVNAGRLAELDELLNGASIVVSAGPAAVTQRTLLGTARCTPRELVARMSPAFADANAALAEITRAWDELTPRLAVARDALDEASERAAALGDAEIAALEGPRKRHAELTATLAHDPLAVSAEEVEALEASLAAANRDLAGAGALRDELEQRLGRARALVQAIENARAEAIAARTVAEARILAPALVEAPDRTDLDAALERVQSLAAAGRWREADAELTRWHARADALLDQARAAVAANRAPVLARNELRGRLDAYSAKAARLRLVERSDVAELRDQARRALFEAPTDLARAEELLVRLQRALSETEVMT
jgi:hypothetical protein